jgi:hypothetical protein
MNRFSLFSSVVLCIVVFEFIIAGNLPAVNGYLEEGEEQNVLHLWGTHYEMGYANGYLNAPGIMEMLEDYAIDYFLTPYFYMYIRAIAQVYLKCPEQLEDEFDGMIDGLTDSGCDIYIESLERNPDALDLMILNAAPESNVPISCSSHSGWGDATIDSPGLHGGLVLCRDLDWSPDPYGILYRNALITTFAPSHPDEQKWVSIGYSGIIGCLSGYNEHGIGAFLNMGNHVTRGLENLRGSVMPELLALRLGIEGTDYDDDGVCTIKDVYMAVKDHRRAGSYCIHAVSPSIGNELPHPAVIIEAHYSAGVAPRLSIHDEQLTPYLLIVTNHHRVLFPRVICTRYRAIKQRLREDYRLGCREAWDIEADVCNSTMQCMLFRPEKRDLWVSFADTGNWAPMIEPVHYSWNDLFN